MPGRRGRGGAPVRRVVTIVAGNALAPARRATATATRPRQRAVRRKAVPVCTHSLTDSIALTTRAAQIDDSLIVNFDHKRTVEQNPKERHFVA